MVPYLADNYFIAFFIYFLTKTQLRLNLIIMLKIFDLFCRSLLHKMLLKHSYQNPHMRKRVYHIF